MVESRVSLLSPVREGWDWMVRMLFRPFDPVKWLVVAFAAWLAGLAGGGNSTGLNWSDTDGGPGLREGAHNAWEWLWSNQLALGLLLGLILLGFVLIVLVLWLSSRAKFVFLDDVVHNRAAIVEPWKRLRRQGNSLFAFRILVLLLALPVMGGLIALCFWLFGGGRLEGVALTATALAVGVLGVILVLTLLYLTFFLDAFVVPIMYRFELGVVDGWRRFFGHFGRNPGWFLLTGLLFYGLGMLALAFIMAVGIMTCCLGFLLVALPYVGTLVTLPLPVFYRAATVAFLSQMEPELRLEG